MRPPSNGLKGIPSVIEVTELAGLEVLDRLDDLLTGEIIFVVFTQ